MSCLSGVDEDDKDADCEINALTLLQEPVRMAQGSVSCTDSLGKPSLKQKNNVLEVMSNTDMLSPVGLGNGPSSHQATKAHDLNSISTEKEEEKNITPLKTVQEIDTAGIWGFDEESPENSVDNFNSASDLHWDPHKEFMQFLWENHGDSPGEEPKQESSSPSSQRRRKRKMDMVVMVDPSEDLYPDLTQKSSEDLSDAEDQVDSIAVRKFQDTDANCNLLDNGIKQEKPNIIYTYSRRMSMRGALQASKRLFDNIKTEPDEPDIPVIKEECIETEVFRETLDHHPISLRESFTEDLSVLDSDQKTCPYCPAVFESGVGLSNHVRGHLHRVGLSYNARHVVPPEQVASQDRRPRIRRRTSAIRRWKKALHLESGSSEVVKSTHSCPLCGDSFDNRTGQSNHIRGHLKRLGKNFSTKSKSPLFLLQELMRDKKEFHRALQILGKKGNHFQYASPKLSSVAHLTPPPIETPETNTIQSIYHDAKPLIPTFSFEEMESDKQQLETKLEVKSSLSGSTALIGILKKRKCQEDCRLKGSTQMSRNTFAFSSNSEHSMGSRIASTQQNLISEKGEFNRKVCIHCNATFHSGVSLSNHLRAYAKRKRAALLEGTTYDCKVRRQRSRPGSKKKTLPISQTPEEMYRLTCRFCDLVFQGPLSVQEDWIKHLQRHIMNTSVPHTGLSMVEVTLLPKDPVTHTTDQDDSLTPTQAVS
ncbi:hypothetical protein LDENG_00124150 [Lucifuga dentata]|nr:hypothetical protein LDENG_00124150 [Lucifuga dentata]